MIYVDNDFRIKAVENEIERYNMELMHAREFHDKEMEKWANECMKNAFVKFDSIISNLLAGKKGLI